jgi:NAD(P)-dependent dehydrogenase (short-subunit alcohol dehydrogenase family)
VPDADGPGVALVTGAAGDIGRATALRLAADGYTVAVNDIIDDGGLAELATCITGVAVPRHAGRIVIISSGWGVIGHPNATAYAASNAGLIALTKGLARELGPQGIASNAIAPS